ncbi:MAG TPA: DUF5009 domain-containing protein [Bacteroidetes bacterium]|nr:DUF5009 domain-containing protein [Bacteroidota bacterium]HRI46136.1 DUF5009 domain-containing protein [Ignavibacteriaceae bacterium]
MNLDSNVRSLGLDALRGFAILTMILSSRIPYGVLPGWMYHVQVPPPLHKFDPSIAGISWVDLVFPFFLFSMGAAFPFALNKRLATSDSRLKIYAQILWRGILLAFFALAIQHMRPHVIESAQSSATLLLAIILFIFLFLLFGKFPFIKNKFLNHSLTGFGLIGSVSFFLFVTYPDGSGFSFRRYDIIILVLSNVALIGSIIWILFRENYINRIIVLVFLFAIRLVFNSGNNWLTEIASYYPNWMLFQPYFLKYLFIVVPGSIIGDILYKWSKTPNKSGYEESETSGKLKIFVAVFLLLVIPINLFGFYQRYILATFLFNSAISLFLFLIYYQTKSNNDKLIKEMLLWGFLWLILGTLLEPFEGGIKKDHSTMSYYFVTTGLAIFMLSSFTILIDFLKIRNGFKLLITNGQNPMLAYAAGTNLLTPLVMLTSIDPLLKSVLSTPWLGVIKGIIVTYLLALIVNAFTKYKIFWRT